MAVTTPSQLQSVPVPVPLMVHVAPVPPDVQSAYANLASACAAWPKQQDTGTMFALHETPCSYAENHGPYAQQTLVIGVVLGGSAVLALYVAWKLARIVVEFIAILWRHRPRSSTLLPLCLVALIATLVACAPTPPPSCRGPVFGMNAGQWSPTPADLQVKQ